MHLNSAAIADEHSYLTASPGKVFDRELFRGSMAATSLRSGRGLSRTTVHIVSRIGRDNPRGGYRTRPCAPPWQDTSHTAKTPLVTAAAGFQNRHASLQGDASTWPNQSRRGSFARTKATAFL